MIKQQASSNSTWLGLVVLTAVGIAGTAYELATERHWNGAIQLIPWITLGLLSVATALLAFRPEGLRTRTTVRVLCVLVLAASGFGVFEHIGANLDAGYLDGRYAATWEARSTLDRLWLAATKTVGPSPPLAPGMLAQSALILLITSAIRPPSTSNEV